MNDNDTLTAICWLCGAERPMSLMVIEMSRLGPVFVCGGGFDPAVGKDSITDCETRRGI